MFVVAYPRGSYLGIRTERTLLCCFSSVVPGYSVPLVPNFPYTYHKAYPKFVAQKVVAILHVICKTLMPVFSESAGQGKLGLLHIKYESVALENREVYACHSQGRGNGDSFPPSCSIHNVAL